MSISNVTEQASRQVREAAHVSRTSLIDFGTQALRLFNGWREAERRGMELMLGRMGLQRRRSALRPALLFAAGAVVGGCVGLAFAPMAASGVRQGFARLRDARYWAERKGADVAATLHRPENGEAHESA